MSIKVRITKGHPTFEAKVYNPGDEFWVDGPFEKVIRKGEEFIERTYGGKVTLEVIADGNDAKKAKVAAKKDEPEGGDSSYTGWGVKKLRDELQARGIEEVNGTITDKLSKPAARAALLANDAGELVIEDEETEDEAGEAEPKEDAAVISDEEEDDEEEDDD